MNLKNKVLLFFVQLHQKKEMSGDNVQKKNPIGKLHLKLTIKKISRDNDQRKAYIGNKLQL